MRILPVDVFFQRRVPGAAGQRHVTTEDAGHYLRENQTVGSTATTGEQVVGTT